VSVERLVAGDRVRVPLGEAFPGDGVLEDGSTQADESLLTGESTPVPKSVGDSVVAGSMNLGAPVIARIERTGADTRFEQIAAQFPAFRITAAAAPAGRSRGQQGTT